MLSAAMAVAGVISFRRMPVDAYPDLSPPQVELITQWPGHAAEEVERLVTLPLELELNGVPRVTYMRSISLYGLSDIILTFDEGTDDYFARQVVFERMSQASLPTGITPSMAPLFSPSGLVYRYVIESPDRSPQELKTFEDWVIERAYRSVHGVADDSGFGGTVMQYQVLLDPARLYGYHLTVPQIINSLTANNSNAGGGFYSQGGQFYYVRGLGLVRNTEDIGDIVVGANNGVPIRVKDIGTVEIGYAPRLGEFGYEKNNDAVEGVILMLRGEQTQNVLKAVEAKTDELNRTILPPDVKIHPYYDRSELVKLTTDTVEGQSAARHGAGADRPDFLPGQLPRRRLSLRSPFRCRCCSRLSCCTPTTALPTCSPSAPSTSASSSTAPWSWWRTSTASSRCATARPTASPTSFSARRKTSTAPSSTPSPSSSPAIFPIYALSGPSGKLFHPMAETMSFALVGALILTLTLVPVLCSYWFKKGVREPSNRVYEWMKRVYATQLDWSLARPKLTMLIAVLIFGATLLLVPYIGGEFMPHLEPLTSFRVIAFGCRSAIF